MTKQIKISPLFKKIEQLQGSTPWGHILDVGTGPKSLSWINRLPSQRWTAVTAQESMIDSARHALATPPREADRLVLGNWADDSLLQGETFDTVLLDYFIGAVDAFAPYFQEALLHRLAERVRGTLYVTGLEPYVPVVADDPVGEFVGDLGRLRDACMLLARDRPYREYPASWVAAQLRNAGLQVTDTRFFSIRYRSQFLSSQLGLCEDRVQRFADPQLTAAMVAHIAQMRRRGEALIEQNDGLRYGRNYVLRAVPTVVTES
ncbi:class I SAM-dependent methyltransferase [Porticoccus sp. GXU_MW_L64]